MVLNSFKAGVPMTNKHFTDEDVYVNENFLPFEKVSKGRGPATPLKIKRKTYSFFGVSFRGPGGHHKSSDGVASVSCLDRRT